MHFSRAPSPTQGRSPKLPPDQAGVLRETARPSHNRISRPPQTRTTIGTPIARNRSLRRSASKAVTFCHKRWSPPTPTLPPLCTVLQSGLLAIVITHNLAFCAPHRPIAFTATGASFTPTSAGAKVIPAGRDEKTRLRFSRISIARCPGAIRSYASARDPLVVVSPPCHRSTRPGPTSLRTRPSAGRRRQHGRTPTAGDGEREPAGMMMSAAGAGTVLSGNPAWPVRAAASQRVGPAICWIRCLTMSRTTASGSGVAAVNRMVPLDSSKAASRSRTASTTWELNGKMLR